MSYSVQKLRYEVAYRAKRSEGKRSGAVLQFRHHSPIVCQKTDKKCKQKLVDMGSRAHDQFYIEIDSKAADFEYKTDWYDCHSRGKRISLFMSFILTFH